MMIDKLTELCLAMGITVTQDTATVGTYSYDCGSGLGSLAPGEDVRLVVTIGTLLAGASSGVLCDYIQATDAALSASVDVLATVTIPTASSAGAKVVDLVVPANTKRYVGVQFTPKGSASSGGTYNAWLVKDTDAQKAYPSGFSIS